MALFAFCLDMLVVMTDETIEFSDHSTVSLVNFMGGDEAVARAAWVSQSYDSREKDAGRIEGLINYLWANKHTSPFEHSTFTFYVKTPLFVRSEFHRHRTFSYNEISGRYTKMKPRFYIPSENRPFFQTGKIGSYTFEPGNLDDHLTLVNEMQTAAQEDWDRYERLKAAGFANEVARDILGLNLFTEFYATANARNVLAFLNLRTAPDALYEIRDVAGQMESLFAEKMPLTHKAWKING